MKTHKNARLTFARRLEMVLSVTTRGTTLRDAAAQHGVSVPTVRKWINRYHAQGQAGLADQSSRPRRSPKALDESDALKVLELRRSGLTMQAIARERSCSVSTVSRICAQAGLSRLPALNAVRSSASLRRLSRPVSRRL